MSSLAPIALFVYNRPSHTDQTLKYLRQNPESLDSDLIIFSDGPRSPAQESEVAEVRALTSKVIGFRSVTVVRRPSNWGLARSVISGVTEVLERSSRIIVLEDDMITSPQFLRYMNTALDRFETESRVGSVHAYMFPIEGLPEFFFMKGGDCWGWGTWHDRWGLFEPDGRRLLQLLKQTGLLSEFDRTGGDGMVRMLVDQIRGKNCSWYIRWHASLFLSGKLTLQPGRSFIHNIGLDNSGTHGGATNRFDPIPQASFMGLPPLDIVENRLAVEQIHTFCHGRQNRRWYRRLGRHIVDEVRTMKAIHYG
jgi:Glycosyl transferase family 2